MKERTLVNALNIFGCMVFVVCVYLISHVSKIGK